MRAPLRVALIGAGDIGRSAHLPALIADPAVELAAVCDPDPTARERVAGLLGDDRPPILTDLEPLLADDTIPAWVVATPPWVGPRIVRAGLDADRFVLAEKPLATDLAAAQRAFAGLAPERVARLQVGFSYRHDPAIDELRRLIADGELGGPLQVRVAIYDEVDDPRDREHGRRIRETLAHGTPVVHEGAHVADWLRFLLGPDRLDVAHSWSLRTRADLPGDNLCGATLTHPAGHLIQVEVGWLLPAAAPSTLTVRGAGGCATIDVMSLDLRVEDGRTVREQRATVDRTTRCFARQLERFVALTRGDAGGSPTLSDGLAGIELTERIAARAGVGA